MRRGKTTYQDLFDVLKSLGFAERLDGDSNRRAFLHSETETLLLFGRRPDDQVTSADMLSAEVHLTGNGLIDQPLESLLQASPVRG